jgi:hypothetical protein
MRDIIKRPETIGISAYRKSFNIKFLEETDVVENGEYDFLSRVIPKSFKYGLRTDLKDRSVAVVGNGPIAGFGNEIDSHDEVIRMSTMRNWKKDAKEDGIRTTIWSGHLAFVIENNSINERFRSLVDEKTDIWALSPFHITCISYLWIKNYARKKILVLPPAAVLNDIFHDYMSPEDISTLFNIPTSEHNFTGLTFYELLLTGTRLILALEASGVRHLSLYGFDLFQTSPEQVWFGHDTDVDRAVLRRVAERFRASGKAFHWCVTS